MTTLVLTRPALSLAERLAAARAEAVWWAGYILRIWTGGSLVALPIGLVLTVVLSAPIFAAGTAISAGFGIAAGGLRVRL